MRRIYILLSVLVICLCGCNTITIDNGLTCDINQPLKPVGPSSDEAVDLGLSVKWAPYNVGANKATDFGNYYAYGETSPKNTYSNSNYTSPTSLNVLGNIISTENDVATHIWGEEWRMPSTEEIEELITKCKWSEETVDGINGYRVKSTNGNSIFLPASGIYTNDKIYDNNVKGYYRHGSPDSIKHNYFNIPTNGIYGCTVRPVQSLFANQSVSIKVPDTEEAIDMGLSVKWAPYNVGASSCTEIGNYYAYGDVEPKNVYSSKNMNTDISQPIYGTDKDVAHVKWGNGWRMPTEAEIVELIVNCQCKLTVENGVRGFKITSDNGNSIFLPVTGYCDGFSLFDKDLSGYYRNGSNPSINVSYFNFKTALHTAGAVRPVLDTDGNSNNDNNTALYRNLVKVDFDDVEFGNYWRTMWSGEYVNNIEAKGTVNVSIINPENDVANFGIIAYDNDKNETIISDSNNGLTLKYDADEKDFTYDYIKGKYVASFGKNHRYKTFVEKKDGTRIVSEEDYPIKYIYNKQPKLTIQNVHTNGPLEIYTYYSKLPYGWERVIDGALFIDTLYSVNIICDIEDIYDLDSYKIKSVGKSAEGIIEGWIGIGTSYINSWNYNNDSYDYDMRFLEGIVLKGVEKDTIRSQPFFFKRQSYNCSIIAPEQIPGWPDKFKY